MGEIIRPATLTVTLTDDEQNVTLGGLYERLSETKRYLNSSRQIMDAHAGHGEACCGRAMVERERESQGHLSKRLAAIEGAIAKLEHRPASDDGTGEQPSAASPESSSAGSGEVTP